MNKQDWLNSALERIDNMSREEFIESLDKTGFFKEKEPVKLPMQPLHKTESGVVRFVANRIVEDLYDFSVGLGFGMNEIQRAACQGKYTKEEQMQFAQLIGYSLSGYADLSYVTDESYEEATTWLCINGLGEDNE